ncbi:glycosyltransferase family 39 protein [Mucilaginibacter sp. dw_454]|uniref:glycosyltransferase family 39 protein n=1 Tax=Mucilaginibacter sp. dw_454 TaxID=2720079 RepID=UPI001BD1C857|nr:glycosyltransferase family 39 protein [Mucilaginibacter sp. dw_454]
MSYQNRKSSYTNFILIFVLIKIGLNALAISHFGFHRDELLHLALGDHLDWGYKEVPPFIAVLAKLTTTLFGDSVVATRIFSTIGGALIVWLVGLITVEFGGKMFAITLACLGIIFAPAFVASDYLFQPVVFDQLWWVLAVWLIVRYINRHSVKYLYFLGLVIGVGLLTKYTMGFFTLALLIGLLFTKQRKLLWNRHIIGAAGLALLIFLPNIIWQFTHHLPVVTHMKTLQKYQLNYITPGNFIRQQIAVNGICLFLWLVGFGFLLFSFKLRKFQFLAFAYVLIFLFLMEMSGKNYYLFGAYPMLFAAGGYAFERWIKIKYTPLRALAVLFFTLPNLILLPMLLPVLPFNSTLAVFNYVGNHTDIFKFAVTWEDQQVHPLTQDYADMLGWDEMAQKVAKAYYNLTPEQRKNTQIYADNYGEASAIHHFGKQYNLPEIISLNSSFTLWAPTDLNAHYIIYVDEDMGDKVKRFAAITDTCRQLSQVDNPMSREKGTAILLLVNAKPSLNSVYKSELAEKRLK